MKYIFGLIACLVLFAFTPSLGYATPDDSQTEKTFKIDVEAPVLSVVLIEVESSKVAENYCFSHRNKPIDVGKRFESDKYNFVNSFNKTFIINRHYLKIDNKNLVKNKTNTPYLDLPIKIGWCF